MHLIELNQKTKPETNTKKEELKKLFAKPYHQKEDPIKITLSCALCKNIHNEEKCTNNGDPLSCSMYVLDTQLGNATILLMLVKEYKPDYFRDQYSSPYIFIEDDFIHKTFHVNSRIFKQFLAKIFYTGFWVII